MLYIIWNTSLSQLKILKWAKDNKRLILSSCVFFWGKGTVLFKTPTFEGFWQDLWTCIIFESTVVHTIKSMVKSLLQMVPLLTWVVNVTIQALKIIDFLLLYFDVQSQFQLEIALLKLWSLQDMLHKSLMLNPGATGSECISFIMSDVMFTSRVIISLSIYPYLFPSNCLWPVHPK